MNEPRSARADIAAFRREVAQGGVTVSYLVAPDDPRLEGEPVLQSAIEYWRRNIPTRKPRCFACRTIFANDGPQLGAFLMATAAAAPTAATIAGLCLRCWAELPDAELERAAAKALRPVMPNGEK